MLCWIRSVDTREREIEKTSYLTKFNFFLPPPLHKSTNTYAYKNMKQQNNSRFLNYLQHFIHIKFISGRNTIHARPRAIFSIYWMNQLYNLVLSKKEDISILWRTLLNTNWINIFQDFAFHIIILYKFIQRVLGNVRFFAVAVNACIGHSVSKYLSRHGFVKSLTSKSELLDEYCHKLLQW